MALSLDGFASNRNNSDSDITASLSTSESENIIVVVAVKFNVGTTDPVTSLTSPNLTFAPHSSHTLVGSNSVTHSVEVWWAYAEDPLSSEVISAVWSGANNPVGLYCFGVNGADLADPWDDAAVLPKKATSVSGSNVAVTVDDADVDAEESILFGIFSTWSPQNCTVTGTWNQIALEDVNTSGTSRGRILIQSKIVSDPQVDLDVTLGSLNSNWGFMIDAIKIASESEPIVPSVTDFDTGSGDYEVPPYAALVIETWGAAASGAGLQPATPGNAGTQSTAAWDAMDLIAGGGQPGVGHLGGVGGVASGGDINLNGGNGSDARTQGGMIASFKGGDSPYGGAGAQGEPGAGGHNGVAGEAPGGGGSAARVQGFALAWEGWFTQYGPSGAGGGYSKKTFIAGDSEAPDVGELIAYVVGVGGAAPTAGALDGGAGANGRVRFTVLAEAPEEPTEAENSGLATVDIVGTPEELQTLTAIFNDDDPDGTATAILFQWKRDGSPITGAIGSTYTLTAFDVGAEMTVTVSYIDGDGFNEQTTSDPTAEVVPIPFPLDGYTDQELWACYSYRGLRRAYIGPVIRLRSGGVGEEEQDFSALPTGELDWAAIEAWRDGTGEFTTVRIVTWYDQSGHGRHLGQSQTVSNIPEFAAGGALPFTLPSGRPSPRFDGNEEFKRLNVDGPNNVLGFLAVLQRDDSNPGPVFTFDVNGGDADSDDAAFMLSRTSAQDWSDNAAVFYANGQLSGRSPRAIKNGSFPENDTDDAVIWDGELSAVRNGLRRNGAPLALNVNNHDTFTPIGLASLFVGPRIFDTGYQSRLAELTIFARDVRAKIGPYRTSAAFYYLSFPDEVSDPSADEPFSEVSSDSEPPSSLPSEDEDPSSGEFSESESASGSESESASASESESGSEIMFPPPVQVIVISQ